MATIRRADLVREISSQCKIPRHLATRAVNEVLGTIIAEFRPWMAFARLPRRFWVYLRRTRGAVVEVKGFGSFHLRQGQKALYVVFRPGRALREEVSQQGDSAHFTKAGTPRRRLLGQ